LRAKYLKFFFLIIPLLVLSSCSEDPSTIGIDQLYSDLVGIKDYDSQTDTMEQTSNLLIQHVSYENSDRILLGKLNEDNISSSIFFRYDLYNYMPDSIKTAINEDSLTVLKASMHLYPNYAYPNSGYSGLNFEVNRINSNWYAYGFTIDSLNKYITSFGPNIRTSEPVMVDTLMYLTLDNAAALEMLKAGADTGYANKDYGFAFRSVGGNKIVGFAARGVYDSLPRLTFILESKKYNDYYIDTLWFTPASDVHVFETGANPSLGTEYMAVRAGLETQSFLLFDFTTSLGRFEIPQNAIINSAQLILKPEYSLSNIQDTNYVSLYATCIGTDSVSNLSLKSVPVTIGKNGDYYTGNITYFVQRWMKAGYNNGMYLSFANGGMTADKIVFYGSKAKPEFRPRIKITYTVKK